MHKLKSLRSNFRLIFFHFRNIVLTCRNILCHTEIVIDRDAVISKEGETYVFVDDNGTAVKKIVETGIDDGTSIQILSGINEGDMVVVKGQTYLSEGDILNVIDDTAAAKTETENSQETSASSEKEE